MWKSLQMIAIPLLGLYVVKEIFSRHKTCITRNMTFILLLVLLSIVMSFVIWGQDIILGYRSTIQFLSIVFYFFLLKSGFEKKEIEKFVIFYGCLWIAIWCANLITFPFPVFGLQDVDAINESRGIARFFIQGNGFLYILFFLLYNKWLCERKKVPLLLAMAAFLIIVLQVTRQTIFFSLLIALYYFFKKCQYALHCTLFAVVAFFAIDVEIPRDSVVGKMIELSQDQYVDNSYGEKNIRIEEYKYFFTEYSSNVVAMLFGNGLPHDESSYGKMYTKLRMQKRFFFSDVGYAGIYIMLGALGLFVFLRFFLILMKSRVCDNRFLWTKMFVVYLFACNIVSFVIMTNVIPLCTVLYLMNENGKHEEIR